MTQAKQGDTVEIAYVGKFDDGSVFDASEEGAPLVFTIGEAQVISGFEEAAIGLEVGGEKTVVIAPEQAYGEYHEELVHEVDLDELPEGLEVEVGMQLETADPDDGEPILLMVTDVDGRSVTLDANHPLAGQRLTFEMKLVAIR